MRIRPLILLVLFASCFVGPSPAQAGSVIFFDDFNSGSPSALWAPSSGSSWVAQNGVYYDNSYYPGQPNYSHVSYLNLAQPLTDFEISVDLAGINDGGLLLRDNLLGSNVVLITGGFGHTGTGFYWHVGSQGSTVFNSVSGKFVNGSGAGNLTVVVSGSLYQAFFNGELVTQLDTSSISGAPVSGTVGLYSWSLQTFDNVTVTAPVPLPASLLLFGPGLAGLAVLRRKFRR